LLCFTGGDHFVPAVHTWLLGSRSLRHYYRTPAPPKAGFVYYSI
jgi:hypothetical protein